MRCTTCARSPCAAATVTEACTLHDLIYGVITRSSKLSLAVNGHEPFWRVKSPAAVPARAARAGTILVAVPSRYFAGGAGAIDPAELGHIRDLRNRVGAHVDGRRTPIRESGHNNDGELRPHTPKRRPRQRLWHPHASCPRRAASATGAHVRRCAARLYAGVAAGGRTALRQLKKQSRSGFTNRASPRRTEPLHGAHLDVELDGILSRADATRAHVGGSAFGPTHDPVSDVEPQRDSAGDRASVG